MHRCCIVRIHSYFSGSQWSKMLLACERYSIYHQSRTKRSNLNPSVQTHLENPDIIFEMIERAFLLLSFCTEHSIGLVCTGHRSQVVWTSRQLLSTITSISARWTQLHQFSLAFTQWCLCEELSLRHEERGKNHFDNEWKWKNDLAAGAQLVCLELSLSLSFPLLHLFLTTLHLYTHAFSFYPSVSSCVSGLLVFRINDYMFLFFPEVLRVCGSIFILLSLLAGLHFIWGQCFTVLYGLHRTCSSRYTVVEFWSKSYTLYYHGPIVLPSDTSLDVV